MLLFFLGFTIGVGVLAGAYPALYLSRFNPVHVLKRTAAGCESHSSGLGVGKGLTVLMMVGAVVGTQTVRAALADPADSLRYE